MEQKIYIDKRPLPVLFFIEYKNAIILLIASILFFTIISHNFAIPGLSDSAYKTAVIFIFAIFLWISNIIPVAITSLLVMGLLSTYNVLESNKIFSFFGIDNNGEIQILIQKAQINYKNRHPM